MSGGVVKAIAEKVYENHMLSDIQQMKVDSLAVMLPRTKAGDKEALDDVLTELDIDFNSDHVESRWITTTVDDSLQKIVLKDRPIHEGLVPNVVGMGVKDAVYVLESVGLRTSLHGMGRVTSQSVSPGTRVLKGQTVSLILK